MSLPILRAEISLFSFIFFSFFIALKSEIYLTFFAPLFVLLVLNFKILPHIIFKFLLLNIFVIAIVASFYLFENEKMARLVFFRSELIIIFSLLSLSKFDIFAICSALTTLKISKNFIFLIFFCVKFIISLKNEFFRIKKTLKARNFKAKTDMFSLKIYANLVSILFIFAINQSEKLQKTLKARNFNENFSFPKSKFYGLNLAEILLIISLFSMFVKQGKLI